MKKLLFITTFLTVSAFAQEDTWMECEKVSYSTNFNHIGNGVYTLDIDITNDDTEVFPMYCVYGELVTTSGVTMEDDNQCENELAPGESRTSSYTFTVTDPNLEYITMNHDVKNTLDQTNTEYCYNEFSFGVNDNLSLEENLQNLEYTSTYFDILGRPIEQIGENRIYIERRVYSNGVEKTLKIYNKQS